MKNNHKQNQCWALIVLKSAYQNYHRSQFSCSYHQFEQLLHALFWPLTSRLCVVWDKSPRHDILFNENLMEKYYYKLLEL